MATCGHARRVVGYRPRSAYPSGVESPPPRQLADRTQPADLDSAGRPRASMGACRSRTNADDRLPADPLGRVEGGDGIVEGRDVADVRPQSSVTHPLDDLTQ